MIDKNSIYPITNGVIAEYKNQQIPEYKGNPLIESLPNMMERDELIRSLGNYPSLSDEELSMSRLVRIHLVDRIYGLFQPLPIHIELEERISKMIRQGYVWRNPFSKEIVEKYYEVYEALERKDITKISEKHSVIPTVNSLSVIGVSGMGKSISIGKILNAYPQVIIHSEYKGVDYSQYQLVYLLVNAPHDGSIKGLCLDIISKFDQYLGTDYYRKVANYAAVNSLLPLICQISKRANLGAMIIDEIQVISKAKSGGKDSFLNFFLTLVNSIGVSVILIGTSEAMSMLRAHFRQSRRFTGKGEIIFNRIESHEHNEWVLFTKSLLRFRATQIGVGDINGVSKALYHESQGILDIAVKLYAMSQTEAIKNGSERVTPELVSSVARTNLVTVRPAIEAIRSNDIGALLDFEDIMPINYSSKNESAVNKQVIKKPKDNAIDKGKQNNARKANNKIDLDELEEDDLRLIVGKGIGNEMKSYNTLVRSGIVKKI